MDGVAGHDDAVAPQVADDFRSDVLADLERAFVALTVEVKGVVDLGDHMQLAGACVDGALGAHDLPLPNFRAAQVRTDGHWRLGGAPVFRQVDERQVGVAHRQAYLHIVRCIDLSQLGADVHHLAHIDQLAQHPTVVGRPHFGALQVQLGLGQGGFGGGHPALRRLQLRPAQHQIRRRLAVAEPLPVDQRLLGPGGLLGLGLHGIHQSRLGDLDVGVVVPGIDVQQNVALDEDAAGPEGRCDALDLSAHLGDQHALRTRRHGAVALDAHGIVGGDDAHSFHLQARAAGPAAFLQRWRVAQNGQADRRQRHQNDGGQQPPAQGWRNSQHQLSVPTAPPKASCRATRLCNNWLRN